MLNKTQDSHAQFLVFMKHYGKPLRSIILSTSGAAKFMQWFAILIERIA